jgi:type I site-specific restriction endonuclease
MKEKIAVTVDMLSTGYNCKDLLNLGFFRPVFSPSMYIQMKGRGTRLFDFTINGKKYPKKNFYILDFCGVAEYFDEKYDYDKPLVLQINSSEKENLITNDGKEFNSTNDKETSKQNVSNLLPIWKGIDLVVDKELVEVGSKGQKVDYMTFRGEFEKELHTINRSNDDFKKAINEENLERIDEIIKEEIFDKAEMYFNKKRLNQAYDLPIDVPSLTMNILKGENLPSKTEIIQNVTDDISYRNQLSFNDKKILQSIITYLFDDKESFVCFANGDYSIFNNTQFNQLGGLKSIQNLKNRESIFVEILESKINN